MDPKGMEGGKFKYIWLLKSIELLYGEGNAWYTTVEKEEVEKLRKMANDCLKLMPPHVSYIQDTLAGSSKVYILNNENYERFMEVLYDFEMKVKDLNNQHGLSSKNREEDEGL